MTNTAPETHCAVCKKPGARWLMRVDGGQAMPVHKPCGKRVQAVAPQGQACKVFPSKELRQEWDVQAFWTGKFKEAQAQADAKKPQPAGD